MRIVVLGAGFGGLETCVRLAGALGGETGTEIVLVDRSDSFVAGAAHIGLLTGSVALDDVRHRYTSLPHTGVRFVHSDVHRIDPAARVVETTEGTIEADVVVIALGAELDVAATPGLAEDGHEFYSVPGVLAARRALEAFTGGRIVVGVCGAPYKCPPAPSAATLAVHDWLASRSDVGDVELSLMMPTDRPIPPSPEASSEVLAAFDADGIHWRGGTRIDHLDPTGHVAVTASGEEVPYDVFLGVPVHRAPTVVSVAGLCPQGWVRVDPTTMQTAHDHVYAIGDIVDIGAPKAGVFAEAQASVAAANIVARHRGAPDPVRGSDHGICYLDIVAGHTTGIDVTFTPGGSTDVVLRPPSPETAEAAAASAVARTARWFG